MSVYKVMQPVMETLIWVHRASSAKEAKRWVQVINEAKDAAVRMRSVEAKQRRRTSGIGY